MRIELGPVSSDSAKAWIGYAIDTLALLRAHPDARLSPHALDGFASLLEEWQPIAASGRPFRWSSDERPERVQYLVHALYVAGTIIEHEAASGRARLRPAAADEFHVQLVREALDALEHESDADAQFVEQLRNLWGVARRD